MVKVFSVGFCAPLPSNYRGRGSEETTMRRGCITNAKAKIMDVVDSGSCYPIVALLIRLFVALFSVVCKHLQCKSTTTTTTVNDHS